MLHRVSLGMRLVDMSWVGFVCVMCEYFSNLIPSESTAFGGDDDAVTRTVFAHDSIKMKITTK